MFVSTCNSGVAGAEMGASDVETGEDGVVVRNLG